MYPADEKHVEQKADEYRDARDILHAYDVERAVYQKRAGWFADDCALKLLADVAIQIGARVEAYTVDDLKEYKSEAAIKAAGKYRQEGKDYVVHDGDVLFFKFNV